jgi:hypothetical protein
MRLIDDAGPSTAALRSALPPTLARALVIVTNHSGHSIDAISTIWTITGADGHVVTHNERCDVFFAGQVGKHVALPNGRILMGPNGCYTAATTPPSDMIVAKHKDPLASLATASTVDIRIASVGFDNGDAFETSGDYIAEIVARVSAAKQVAALFRSRLASGKGLSEILAEMNSMADSAPALEGSWIRDYSTAVSGSNREHLMPRISGLEQIRIPTFVVRASK